MVKIAKGDFVRIEYTGRTVGDNRTFDTTSEEIAKKEKIHEPNAKYAPGLVVVGKGTVIRGLDEALEGMEVGQAKTIEINPDKGFGERKPDLVRIIPEAELRKRDINAFPGQILNIDGSTALVKSVNSGRVMIDFNHLLAGKKLSYEVKLVEKLDSMEQKTNALLETSELPGKTKVAGSQLDVVFPPEVKKDARFLVNKASFVENVMRLLPELKTVRVTEEYSADAHEKEHAHEHSHAEAKAKPEAKEKKK